LDNLTYEGVGLTVVVALALGILLVLELLVVEGNVGGTVTTGVVGTSVKFQDNLNKNRARARFW